ncbi:MAG: Ig-like domain-containing domain [Janthinobacterium lividum]
MVWNIKALVVRAGWGPAGLLALAALGGCAAVGSPQGGPRDKTPPRLVATSPDSAARNVHQQFIRLTFSEPVQLKELSKQLLITPQLPPDNAYSTREDRNVVSLIFKKPLDANTTYSFNFRRAIVDVTESQPARYQALSFSTGATLDSGRVQGRVVDLLTGLPAKDAAVGLYRAADTTKVRRDPPYYLARTDDKGQFQLNFVRVAPYRIYAWVDKNSNGRFDDGEKIAYLPAPLLVTDTTAARTLRLVRPDRLPPRRTGLESTAEATRLRFDEGLATARLAPLAPSADSAAVRAATLLADQGRLVEVFKTPAVGDGRYLLTVTDSTGNTRRDTVNLRFPVPTSTARKAVAAPITSLVGSPRSVYRQGQLQFRFAVPVRLVPGKAPGTLTEDSVRTRPLRVPADARLSANGTQLTLVLDTKAQKYIEIRLDTTALLTVTGQSLGLRRAVRLLVTDQEPTGVLLGTIQTKQPSFFLQLLNEKYEVVEQRRSPKGPFRFERLPPGKYRLRALIDANNDGRWYPGDPNLQQPAEPVYLYPKLLDIRAGFEIEEKLSF